MRFLITGATGFVGVKLTRELFMRGHQISVLSRNPQAARDALAVPCEVFGWDPASQLPPAEAFDSVDVVVNMMGENIGSGRWTAEKKQRIVSSRVTGTKHLVEGYRKHGPKNLKAWISYSAIGFYPSGANAAISDEHTPSGSGFLAEVCRSWEAESALINGLTRHITLRVGTVVGRGGGVVAKLRPLFKLGLGGPVGDGRQMMSWIHVDDLVNLTIKASEDETFESGVYNAVAPEPVNNRQLVQALASAVKRVNIIPVPKIALKLVFGEMSELVLASQKVVSKKLANSGFSFRYPTIDEAVKEAAGLASIGLQGEQILCEQFESVQFIDRRVDEVFRFFSVPDNLSAITPPFLNFKILEVSTKSIQKDTLIKYQLSLRGIPIKWKTLIKEWDEGREFVDFQLSGPYKYWHHRHIFIPMAHGTLILDRVDYKLPLSWLGDLFAGWFVKRDVNQIFEYRRQAIKRLLAAPYLAAREQQKDHSGPSGQRQVSRS